LLKTNIAALSGKRALNLPEHEGKEEDVKYSAVINWLNQYSRWLGARQCGYKRSCEKSGRSFCAVCSTGMLSLQQE
jgi:hypothetical protein